MRVIPRYRTGRLVKENLLAVFLRGGRPALYVESTLYEAGPVHMFGTRRIPSGSPFLRALPPPLPWGGWHPSFLYISASTAPGSDHLPTRGPRMKKKTSIYLRVVLKQIIGHRPGLRQRGGVCRTTKNLEVQAYSPGPTEIVSRAERNRHCWKHLSAVPVPRQYTAAGSVQENFADGGGTLGAGYFCTLSQRQY